MNGRKEMAQATTKTGHGAPLSIGTIAAASAIGTTIEWYDFFLYNTMTALVLNKLFFPNADILISTLISTLGVASHSLLAVAPASAKRSRRRSRWRAPTFGSP